MRKQNLHTHSTYCDGKDSLEEMISFAIEKNFQSIGFSSHCYSGLSFDDCGIKTKDKYYEYLNELTELKTKYQGKIEIFKGVELESITSDALFPAKDKALDYAIGSVHWFYLDNRCWAIDYKPEIFQEAENAFGGKRRLLESYYEEISKFASSSDYDILGHIDLVTKFSERMNWDFESYSWYRDAAISALECAIKHDKFIEVNTGAISRGYRTSPYPAPFLLKRIKELNGKVILTSDCHNKNNLECFFKESLDLLASYNITQLYFLTKDGFIGEKIK